MTGTPLDLTPFGPLLKSVGYVYWLIALGLAAFALWVPGRWWVKLPIAALILGAFAYPVVTHKEAQQQQVDAAKVRLDAAVAHFEMRCKGAGEKITRTIENVDGVVWMKWRDKQDVNDDYDQFKLSDPYGRDCNGKGCIEQLLRIEAPPGRFLRERELRKSRYKFVESIDPIDGLRVRYAGSMTLSWSDEAIKQHREATGRDVPEESYRFALNEHPIDRFTARYGITWDDISTREDRKHWVAGGSITVVDLKTNEVIAERVGFMMDRGLGSRGGFRTPWLMAERTACPAFRDGRRGAEGRNFVFSVLKSSEGK